MSVDEEEVCTKFWFIADMFDFENIGFLRVTEARPNLKYLTCAGCEKGVLGVQLLEEKRIYLEAQRVRYL